MKLVVLYILLVPAIVLVALGASLVVDSRRTSIFNPGQHGFSEVLYAYTSAANNNGWAFAGISADTQWINTTLGPRDGLGRFSSSSRARDRRFARPQAACPAGRARSRPTRRCSSAW